LDCELQKPIIQLVFGHVFLNYLELESESNGAAHEGWGYT